MAVHNLFFNYKCLGFVVTLTVIHNDNESDILEYNNSCTCEQLDWRPQPEFAKPINGSDAACKIR